MFDVPSMSFQGTSTERRAFAFFYQRTSTQLNGFDDHTFWEGTVLQVAHIDVGVRHALIALAYLHEDFENGAVHRKVENTSVLKHYNLAIRNHLNLVANHEQASAAEAYKYLIPCLIFIVIEVLPSCERPLPAIC